MKVYVSELSLRATLEKLSLADLPQLASDHGFDGVELSHEALASLGDTGLREFGRARERAGGGLVVDVSCDLTYGDPSTWQREVERVRDSIDFAWKVGAEVARIWLGGQLLSLQKLRRRASAGRSSAVGTADQIRKRKHTFARLLPDVVQTVRSNPAFSRLLSDVAHALRSQLPSVIVRSDVKTWRAARALHRLVPHAEERRVPLAIENHWGISSRPEIVLRLLSDASSPFLGSCIDLGNFPVDVDRYEALKSLAPTALLVHAKTSDFGPEGEEREIDYRRCAGILRGAGYDGVLSVEYVGVGDELEGCARTRNLLLRHWGGSP